MSSLLRAWKGLGKLRWAVLALAVVLVIVVATSGGGHKASGGEAATGTGATAATSGSTTSSPPSSSAAPAVSSIGTTRAAAETVLGIQVSGIKWKPSVLSSGEPRVIGQKGADLIELDGPATGHLSEETLELAVYNPASGAAAEALLTLVANEYGRNPAGIWVQQAFNSMARGGTYHAVKAAKVFGKVKLSFSTNRLSGVGIFADLDITAA